MFRKLLLSVIVTASFVLLLSVANVEAQTSSILVSGLRAPGKIIHVQQKKYFLVSESGIAAMPNSGRISIVTIEGDRFTLIDGLPSGQAPPNNDPSGPSAMTVQGNRLYIAIGGGNSVLNGPAPGSEIPNPNPNSPIFSSVIEFRFPSRLPLDGPGYTLSSDDHARLANGDTVLLGNGNKQARVRLIGNFPDFTPNFRPDVPNNVRPSNPFGLVLQGDTLYVTDAAQNNIRTIDRDDGTIGELFRYPSRPNPAAPMGPPFIDPVPTNLRLFGNKLIGTFLTGFPFPAGAADVRQYDLESGAESQLIGGLRSAIDVLTVDEGGFCSSFYTLEFSANMLMGAPGILKRFDSPTGQPTVVVNNLISPTSMARHPATGDLLVTEIFPGRITRISLP